MIDRATLDSFRNQCVISFKDIIREKSFSAGIDYLELEDILRFDPKANEFKIFEGKNEENMGNLKKILAAISKPNILGTKDKIGWGRSDKDITNACEQNLIVKSERDVPNKSPVGIISDLERSMFENGFIDKNLRQKTLPETQKLDSGPGPSLLATGKARPRKSKRKSVISEESTDFTQEPELFNLLEARKRIQQKKNSMSESQDNIHTPVSTPKTLVKPLAWDELTPIEKKPLEYLEITVEVPKSKSYNSLDQENLWPEAKTPNNISDDNELRMSDSPGFLSYKQQRDLIKLEKIHQDIFVNQQAD